MKKLYKQSLQPGFTLIELLVVIAIIAILSGIVIASLSGVRQKAKVAKFQVELRQFRMEAEGYYLKNSTYEDVCHPTTSNWLNYINNFGGSAQFDFVGCKDIDTGFVAVLSLLPSPNDYTFICIDARGYDVVTKKSTTDLRPSMWTNTHCR